MKKLSTAEKMRRLIDQGHTNKAIIERMGVKPQVVYNMRYQMNKARGLGAIGTLPTPASGIGAPPKRKYTRRVKAGTGIVATSEVTPVHNAYPYTPVIKTPATRTVKVKPTLWQRIVGIFKAPTA